MRRDTLLAAATGTLLAGVLWLELQASGARYDAASQSPVRTNAHNPSLADAPSVTAVAEAVLARPLFSPDRKPVAAAHPGASTLPRLTGTIRTDSGELAIFQPKDGKPIVLGRGGAIADWTIADIADGEVALQRGGSTSTLRLSYANGPVSPAQPAAAPQLAVLHERWTNPFLQP
jgi:hypothetical protein